MLIAIIPLVAAVVGLLMYVLAANPKVVELGRILFAAGILVALWLSATHVVHLG